MKKISCLFTIMLITITLFAQAPNSFKYQAVLRDAGGNIKASANVTIVVSILQGTSSGTSVYSETHNATTNAFGLVNLEMGSKNPTIFSTIDWSNGPYFVKITVDGTVMGASQLLSVPYALYAETSGSSTLGPKGDQGEQGIQGSKGDQGIQGIQGSKGDKGDTGATGKSAYQLWLEAGNSGTQTDFIASLKGNKGDQGEQGIQGPNGDKGDTGEAGTQGIQGLKGDQGDQGIQGLKGDKGDQGIQGVKGDQGDPGVALDDLQVLTNKTWTSSKINTEIGNKANTTDVYTKGNMQTGGSAQLHFNNITNKPSTLTGYGISDAMNTSHSANGITSTNISNWNTAYGWGNHSGLYRPISYVPTWSEITSNPFSFATPSNNQLLKYNSTSNKWENWTPNYLTSEAQTLSLAGNQLTISGAGGNTVTFTNWDIDNTNDVVITGNQTIAGNKIFQNSIAVNAAGSSADITAMLDVSSTTKGLLIPRMTSAQRLAIVTPANGLTVFQTDGTSGYYYYDGIWKIIGTTNIVSTNYWTQAGSSLYYNDGFVGIGTNPGAQLHVQSNSGGAVDHQLAIFGDNSGYPYITIGPGSNAGGYMKWTTSAGLGFGLHGAGPVLNIVSGNIGLGTATPVNKLDVEGAAVIGTTYSGTNNAPSNGLLVEGNVGLGTTSPVNKLDIEGGAVIGATYSGTYNAPTNGLLVEGNMGIGTTGPGNKLEVNIGTSGSDGIQVTGSSSWGPYVRLRNSLSSGQDWFILSGGGQDGNTPLGSLSFHQGGGGTRMAILSNGNVGIWTTSPQSTLGVAGNAVIGESWAGTQTAPGSGFMVEGNVRLGSNLGIGLGPATDPVNRLDVKGGAVIGATYSGTNGAPTNGLLVEGNVGIGTTGPGSKLEVNIGTSSMDGIQVTGNSLWGPYVRLRNSITSGQDWFILSGGGQDWNSPLGGLSFHQGGGGTRLTILNNGNVGIGTTSPLSTLGVTGNAVIGGSWAGTQTAPGSGFMVEGNVRLGSNLGIGLGPATDPVNRLDVKGGAVIGATYSGTNGAPTNGLLVEGNVGIGTTGPGNKLEVNIGTSGMDGLQISGNSSWGPFIRLRNSISSGADWYILSGGGQDVNSPLGGLSFHQGGGGTRMTIASNGNVGIGTISPQSTLGVSGNGVIGGSWASTQTAPGSGFMVEGNVRLGSNLGIGLGPTTDPVNRLDVKGGAVIGATYSGTNGAPVNGLLVEGNVGIGTVGPGAPLHVQSNSEGAGDHQLAVFGDNLGNPYITIGPGSNSGGYIKWTSSYSGLGFGLHGSGPVLNLVGGMVGIGTSNPNQSFVVGAARKTYCNGTSWGTDGSDYAEWFENEEILQANDIAGINLETGKVRKYRNGDEFLGIVSTKPAIIGNDKEGERSKDSNYTLVGLLGQLDFDKSQIVIKGRLIQTPDGKKIGILLSNGKVLVGR